MDHLYTVNAFVLDRQFTDLFAVIPGVASGIMFLAWLVQRPHNVGNLQLALIRKSTVSRQAAAPGVAQRSRVQAESIGVPVRRRVGG